MFNKFEVVPHNKIEFEYVNWKGIKEHRRIGVCEFYYGSTEHHKEPQWLLEGFDLEKKTFRKFAMKDMTNVKRI